MTVIRHADIDALQLQGRRSADPLDAVASSSSVRIVELEPGSARTAHRHPLSEEIVVVATGAGSVWIDNVATPVTAGDVVHIPAGAAHATIPSEPMVLHCFFPHPDLSANIEETDITVTETT